MIDDFSVSEDIALASGEIIGRIIWTDCKLPDDAQLIMDKAVMDRNYPALLRSGVEAVFPFRLLEWIHINPPHAGNEYGRKRIRLFIEQARQDGMKRIYLKAAYDWTLHWEVGRDRIEKYYDVLGFTGFKHNEEIRPLMLLNL